jgi:hypothetical protein
MDNNIDLMLQSVEQLAASARAQVRRSLVIDNNDNA